MGQQLNGGARPLFGFGALRVVAADSALGGPLSAALRRLGFFSGSDDEATSPPKRNAADPVPSGKMGCENERRRDA